VPRESFYITWALHNYKSKVLNILSIAVLRRKATSLGYIHTNESKLKMSSSFGALKLGNNNSMFNKFHTNSTKKAISLSMKDKIPRKHNALTKEKK
jgi:hypothetical protein